MNLLDYKVSKHGVHNVLIEASVGMHRLRDYPVTKLFGVEIQRIMYQLLKGVAHIHSKGVMHKALTPKNVYFNSYGTQRCFEELGLGILYLVK
ncbi:hypothetical protein PRUPE_8G231100 [Prunus persica]|uniref:Protein kinase domain-containing protein n=1 Tax=Prunus persica TaxID=3760 RepID=A0A251N243_PRUPE|nr:hypothetical protein PRUPE_8G231100 [Prunus persica]